MFCEQINLEPFVMSWEIFTKLLQSMNLKIIKQTPNSTTAVIGTLGVTQTLVVHLWLTDTIKYAENIVKDISKEFLYIPRLV